MIDMTEETEKLQIEEIEVAAEVEVPATETITVEAVAIPPHEAIRMAEQVLMASPPQLSPPPYMESNIQAYDGTYSIPTIDQPPQATAANPLSVFEKFSGVTQNLRDEEATSFDLFRVRKLNLAATVETLERAVTAHESFPSADAGIAVAKLSEQVSQLTKELERSQDPQKLFDTIEEHSLQPLTRDIIKTLGEEAKWLISQFENHVVPEKRAAFRETVKQTISRCGPALSDSLDNAKQRLMVSLSIKEKK